jgi:hypothetical protein
LRIHAGREIFPERCVTTKKPMRRNATSRKLRPEEAEMR